MSVSILIVDGESDMAELFSTVVFAVRPAMGRMCRIRHRGGRTVGSARRCNRAHAGRGPL